MRHRILLGTVETSGFIPDLADGLMAQGHDVTTAITVGRDTFGHVEYDMDIGEDVHRVDWTCMAAWFRGELPGVRPRRDGSALARMLWLVKTHDVFVFMYGSLRPDWKDRYFPFSGMGREFPFLKRLGKRIVSIMVGPDARDHGAFCQQATLLRHPLPPLGGVAKVPLHLPMLTLRRAECYSDVIFSQPNQSALALRPYWHINPPLRVRDIPWRIPGRDVPVVVHAPSYGPFKGTARILQAVERLKESGVPFEFRLMRGVSNLEVMQAVFDADVVVDQLYLPALGRLGAEALASGCVLATCNREDLEPWPPDRPIVHVDADNVETALRDLLLNRSRRLHLAEAGRRHAEKYHDHVQISDSIVRRLDDLSPPDHHPEFFARHFTLPPGVRLSRRLRDMSRRVVTQYGLPPGITPTAMASRGLM